MSRSVDETCRLLDERGIEHDSIGCDVSWADARGWTVEANADTKDGTMLYVTACMTPEQAIAATLGTETCHIRNGKCDQCGAFVREDAVAYSVPIGNGIRMSEHYDVSFCPHCGRRVEVDE